MQAQTVRRISVVAPGLALLALTALLTACAQHPAAKPAGAAAPPASEAPAPAAAAPVQPAPAEEQPVAKATAVEVPQQDRPKAKSPASGAFADVKPPARSGVEPPDGVWLTDEAGNEFYLEKLPRYEGKYKWLSETKVNYMGVKIDVVDADDDWFYTKVYRVRDYQRSVKRPDPTPEELAAVAAQYQTSTPESDALQFVAFDRGLPATGQWRNGFVLVDMNGDGHLDIVHCPPRKGFTKPVIFLGDGAGNWRSWREARFPRDYDYGDLAVGDFNGDGHQDIVLGIHLRGLRVLVGDSKGNFTEWSDGIDYQVPGQGGDSSSFSSRAVKAVDWDGDGKLDVLALGEGPRVGNPTSEERREKGLGAIAFISDGPAVFLNQGDGKWIKKNKGAGLDQLFGDDLDVGDLNGDGRMDFVTSSSRMGRLDLVNIGGTGAEWQAEKIDLVRRNAYIRAVAIADFDRNGRNDLAIAFLSYSLDGWRNGLDILYSEPGGGWRRHGLFAREGRVALYSVGPGDLNGDGHLDLVTLDADGGMQVFLADGKGGFSMEKSPEIDQLRGRCRGYRVRLADLDGDGRDEVVADYADEASAMFDPQRCLNGGGVVAIKPQLKAAPGR